MGIPKGNTRSIIGLFLGPSAFLILFLLPAPGGLSSLAWHTVTVGTLMAIWWVTEAIPVPATALLPLLLFPLLKVLPIDKAAAPYANPLIFLFMGGFLIALAMQYWNLHKRIALRIVRAIGTSPQRIIVGFMIASAFLSMWVSNTATALMMLPVASSVIELSREGLDDDRANSLGNFPLILLLSIAFACNIGGVGTLVGTPPNAFLAGFVLENYGIELSFARWMTIGVPLVCLFLPLTYLLLTRLYPIEMKEIPGGKALIEEGSKELGPLSKAEKRVGGVFIGTALLWITRPLLDDMLPGLSDTGIAMLAGLLLFLIPAGEQQERGLLTWKEAEELPWGILILFGGGLSLAKAVKESGLAASIGELVSAYSQWPFFWIFLSVLTCVVFLTCVMNNTATSAAFLPILGAAAIGAGQNPYLLLIPAAIGASCAFMLPVSTPPNAIVYSAGWVSILQMSRAGFWMNLIAIVLISLLAYSLLLWSFRIDLGEIPSWAAS
ncbi:MAG: DASS family sodium-coupled anion symporter [Flavobacteriales bacterium]